MTIFLPTTASDNVVKKEFLEFEVHEVHDIFAGKSKKAYNEINNDKPQIKITPYKTKHYILLEIFIDKSRSSQVMWVEKRLLCKNCMCVHMLRGTCHPASDNLTG